MRKEIIWLLLGSLLCYTLVSIWGVTIGRVSGTSMEPTYQEGQYFFVKSYTLLFRDPCRNEVVVLLDNQGYSVIKRVILVPGDWDNVTPGRPHRLDKNQFVVMGDNRSDSIDSRTYGAIGRAQLIGVVQ